MTKRSGRARTSHVEDPAATTTVTSTEAQNALGELIDRVGSGERVYITRYGRPRAVLVSAETWAELAGPVPVDLSELEASFEARLRRMQTPDHQSAVDTLFEMSGEEVGKAAFDTAPLRDAEGC
ncbi:MAG: type II toxin-antitoxin system Phd/YefM family antitoxin [Longimicrobiales bacterium]|nr:type II toxin-antitoxin system Phd/YefM family antitoxin [Longimicrobiales bacterium]